MQGAWLRRHWRTWALVFGLWNLIALFDATQSYLYTRLVNHPMTWREIAGINFACWDLWAVFTPFLVAAVRRWPLVGRHWARALLPQAAAVLLCSAVKVLLDVPCDFLFRETVIPSAPVPRTFWWVLQLLFLDRFVLGVMVGGFVVGIANALDALRRHRAQELEASRLEAELAQAQLQLLKMQLHPHFLFNTLHAISALLHQDVELADRMIARLGDLLRLTLENAGTQEVRLEEELAFIDLYLEIERARLGPRLKVHWEVDPEARAAAVPNLILQPLVENAVRHGIARHSRPGRIEIRARRARGWLQVQVRDDGPGLTHGANPKEGVGVSSTRARLRHLYGAGHRFEMGNGPDGGCVVTLAVPFREPAGDETGDADGDPRPDRG
jgi:signal transduction histidine kinase